MNFLIKNHHKRISYEHDKLLKNANLEKSKFQSNYEKYPLKRTFNFGTYPFGKQLKFVIDRF